MMTILQILLIPLLLSLVCIILFLIHNVTHRMNYWQRFCIPHDKPNLLFGNLQGIKTKYHLEDIYLRYYNKYKGTGPFCGFYYFQTPAAFLLDLKLIENVLIKDFNKFADRPIYYNEKDDPLSVHLITIPGYKWKQLRPKLATIFSNNEQKLTFPHVKKLAKEFVSIVNERLGKKHTLIDIKGLFIDFTLDVIATDFFGIEVNCLRNTNAKFRDIALRALHLHNRNQGKGKFQNLLAAFATSYPDLARKFGITVIPAECSAFFKRIVETTVAFRESNKVRKNDLLDALIECKNKSKELEEQLPLTIEEMTAQCFVTLLAGYETLSSTGCFVLYELALHQDVQERLRNEIKDVLERQEEEKLTFECIKELQYMNQVILETLRHKTIIPSILRRALVDYVVPDSPGYVIKQGTMIIIPAAAIHKDPAYFHNPDVFNPDNFLPENMQKRNSVTTLSFGEGPRNCIGRSFAQMELRLILAMLLKNFKFSLAVETEIPIHVDKTKNILDSVGGILLKVEKIKV